MTRKNRLPVYETGIFCFLCIQLFVLAPKLENSASLFNAEYLLSYRYGVSSRSFIPTIIDILSGGGFISAKFIWSFIFCSLLLLAFMLSVLMGFIIRKSRPEIQPFVLFLSLFYVTCFTAPSAYFLFFSRFEIFAFIFMLIIPVIVDRLVLRWFVPLLALFILASHIILIFFYIPFIIILLFYAVVKTADIKKPLVLLCVTAVVIITAFLLYFLFHENTFMFNDAQSMAAYLRNRTDINFDEYNLYMFMYASLQDHLDGWKQAVHLDFSGNFSVIINIPFVALFAVFWVKCFQQEKKKPVKFFFALPVLLLFYHAIAFFLFFDFGRWMVMILNIQIMLLFYLIYTQNETVIATVQKIVPFIQAKSYPLVLACVLMTCLGPVTVLGPSARVSRIFHALFNLFGWAWN